MFLMTPNDTSQIETQDAYLALSGMEYIGMKWRFIQWWALIAMISDMIA